MSTHNLLTTAEAAARLNLKTGVITRYCREGRLQATKMGRDWLIPENALKEFIAIPRKVGRPPNPR